MSASEVVWTGKKTRDTFVEFFKSKDHTHVPSSGSVPVSRPLATSSAGALARRAALFVAPA